MARKKKRKHITRIRALERSGWIVMPLDVGMISSSRTARSYVKEHAWCGDWERRGKEPFARSRRGNRKHVGAVRATITVGAYLTADVPEKLSERTFTVKTFGEVLVRAAQMYAKIYAEDERLGGESTTQRDARLKRKKQPRPLLRNRGFGPYIWGHDIGDLVFEQAHVKWTGKNTCNVTFGIGS